MAITKFEKNEQLSRVNVNTRFDQMTAMFPVKYVWGGTGATTVEGTLNNLGGYTRRIIYDNWAGSSSGDLEFSGIYRSSDNLYALGIYYGINYIKCYSELNIRSGSTINSTLSMRYLTGSGNLVMRSMPISFRYTTLRRYTTESDFFEPDGGYWYRNNEPLLIYKVVAFYEGATL